MKNLTPHAVAFAALCLAPACADQAQARAPQRSAAAQQVEPVRRYELLLPDAATAGPAAPDHYVGVLLPEQATDVVAAQAGLVEGMHAALGEVVNAGQLLVSLSIQQAALEHDRAVAEREAARAGLERARIEQLHAQQEAERNQRLVSEGLVTQEHMAQASFRLSESRALAAEAESRLAERTARAQQLLALRDQTRVTASFRGRVAVRYVSAGARVAVGTPLLRLISDGAVVLRFAVPEQDTTLQVGSQVELVPVEFPELTLHAKVQRLAPEIDSASRMRTIEAAPSPADAAQLTEAGLLGAIVNVRVRQGDES
jgi:membrane fusion protein, multidrug efflux system